MKILVACEESQAVTIELRKLGHEAYSCDILECSGGHPEWHLQQDVTELLKQKWDGIIAFPPCFTKDTLVLTRSGYKYINEILIGEEVLTHRNRWRKVTDVMKRYASETLEVHFSGSSRITTTKEHPFYISERFWKYKNGKNNKIESMPSWKNAGELEKGDLSVFELPPIEENDLPNDLLWLMGRYVADGHLRYRDGRWDEVHFNIGKNKINEFEKKCNFKFNKAEMRTAYRCSMYGHGFCGQFAQFGCGAENKTLPGWVLTLGKEKAKVFLDGYLSGDGYINDKRTSASSISKKLVVSVGVLMRRVYNRATSVNCNERKKTTVIEGRTVNQNPSWVVYCANGENKRSTATVIDDMTLNVFREKRELGGNVVYNLSVEEDESYVVDQCIVHNCTHLAVSGARHFKAKRESGVQEEAIEFFMNILTSDCEKIAVENPVGIIGGSYIKKHFPNIICKYGDLPKATQYIQPYEHGDEATKKTGLWLKGLPKLKPTNIVSGGENIKSGGKNFQKWNAWFYDEDGKIIAWNDPRTAKLRSKTFPGIAKAMAEQWFGKLLP